MGIVKGMKAFVRVATWSLIGVLLFGCGTGPKVSAPDLSSLPECGKDGKPHKGGPEYAILEMSKSRIGHIRLINGEPFMPDKCDYLRIVLPAGEYRVHFVYMKSLYLLHPRGRDPVSLTFNAEAGKTYLVIVEKHPLKSLYNCRVEEAASGKILHQIDDCDRDEVRRPALKEILEAFGGREAYLEYQSKWWPDQDFEALHRHLR